ncbi:hypothetical protein, partial [Thiolapillus sp.]
MFSLWRKARRENSAASRLLGSTSLRFALHGWQRGRRLQMLNEKIDRINKKTMCNSVGHYAWKDALTRAEAAAL